MQPQSNIPYGFCQCGCGQQTKIASRNRPARGWIRNQPISYINDHNAWTGSLDNRFWKYVIKPTAPSACWQWIGSVFAGGYGKLFVKKVQGRSIHIRAHRFSYEFHIGRIPDGLFVLHHCDNPPCTNPAHLFLGRHVENAADMMRKGRMVIGKHWCKSTVPTTLITEELVRQIRLTYPARTNTRAAFANQHGISERALKHIIEGNRWKHVT